MIRFMRINFEIPLGIKLVDTLILFQPEAEKKPEIALNLILIEINKNSI